MINYYLLTLTRSFFLRLVFRLLGMITDSLAARRIELVYCVIVEQCLIVRLLVGHFPLNPFDVLHDPQDV